MKDCSSENKQPGFFNRVIPVWHIVYIVILCAVINIFLLLICPGKINDDAFTNFSFASTLISIVLAVVSIVYSLQSGLSNLGQINSIREIESRINDELNKFSTIDDKINSALKPVNDHLCSIEKQTSGIQRKQNDIEGQFIQVPPKNSGDVPDRLQIFPIVHIVLYACKKCYETKKKFPFFIFKELFEEQAYYCTGIVGGIASLHSDALEIVSDSSSDVSILSCDVEKLGIKDLETQIRNIKKEFKVGANIIQNLDAYYKESAGNSVP